jgi:PAS domain S-box-containing protein
MKDREAIELLNATPVGQLLLDRDVSCLTANRALLTAFGLTESAIRGRPFTEVFPGLAPQLARMLREVLGIGEPFLNFRIHDESPSHSNSAPPQRGWLVSAVPICDEAGRVIQVAVTLLETDARPYVEDEQKRSLFQAVFEQAVIGMTVIDWRDKGVRTNPAMLEMLGYTAEEMLQLGIEGISHPDDYALDLQLFHRVMAGEIDRYELDKRFVHKDGHLIWTHVLVSMTRDAGGQPSLIISMAENINDRKRVEGEREKLQAQLLHAQKLESLGVLAGGIAHDFNNFLGAIMGSASVAQRALPAESPVRADLDNVMAAAERAASLTRQLVAYAGKGSCDVTVVRLSEQVRELAGILRTTISKRIELQLDLEDDLAAIKVDSSQLQQVIMNLVINGAEAIGDAAGQVAITTGVQQLAAQQLAALLADPDIQPGSYCTLRVRDTGTGMDATTQARIFDPFFTTKFAGRGLGLAAVLGIVRAHRGAMKVTSEVGKGTTFDIYWPVASEKPAGPPASVRPFRGEGTALVIDDDDGVRRAMASMLEDLGFAVLQAMDGREGVRLFADHAQSIQLVLLDMTMPKLSGEEAFREISRIRPGTRVLLTSGYPEADALSRFAAEGLAGFIQKPFSSRDLTRKLTTILGKS